jgi:hypothetical protein
VTKRQPATINRDQPRARPPPDHRERLWDRRSEIASGFFPDFSKEKISEDRLNELGRH